MEIKLGPSYFKNEVRSYANFGLTFFRELTQNSSDANASRIDITIEDKEHDLCLIKFKDNGNGMNFDILTKIFLILGETTKTTNSSVGGFGRARSVTHFGSESYVINTQDCIVCGRGSEYEITTGNPYVDGCEMEIVVEAKDRYGNKIDMQKAAESFFSKCQLDCDVYINGIRFTSWLYKRKFCRTLESLGHIYTNNSGNTNSLYVRVNGVFMFSRYVSANSQVVLEIPVENSRDILVSNRDSLKSEFCGVLDSFLNQLACNTNSALKDRSKRYTKRFGNSCRTKEFRIKLAKSDNISQHPNIFDGIMTNEKEAACETICTENSNESIVKEAKESTELVPASLNGTDYSNITFKNSRPTYREVEQENVYIYVDISSYSPINKVLKSFEPSNWTNKTGKKRRQLLKLWTTACDEVLTLYAEMKEKSIRFVTGFYFNEQENEEYGSALHQEQGEVHCLLFNPVFNSGKLRYSVTNRDSWSELISLATHEICHLSVGDHNEDFSSLLTNLNTKVLANYGNIIKAMKRA